jgi:PAS domain S-box-containing protein
MARARSAVLSYLLCAATLVAAILLRAALDPMLGEARPMVTLFGPVAIAAWLLGWLPATAFAIAGYLLASWYFIPPRGTLQLGDTTAVVGMLAYFLTCALLIGFGESMRRSQQRVRDADREALQQQKGLRESEERLRVAQSAGHIGTFEWNIRTGASRWTPELERMHGLQPGGHPGHHEAWRRRVHPEELERMEQVIAESLVSGDFEAEWRILRPDGSQRWLAGWASVFRDEAGEAERMIGACIDITDRKQAELLLREADRSKDEFLATLAHELRNPLAPLRTSLEIVRRADGDAGVVAEAHATMERQVAQMVRLIDDLLDVSRISRNKLELRREPLDLVALVRETAAASLPQFEQAGLELRVELPDEPLPMQADPVRLAQVLGNLLTNAGKYTESGGHVRLSLRREGAEAVLTVEDDGLGIPPEMLPRVFEMFTQIGPPLDRTQGGLGIGLALVRRMVELHGGRVAARSEGLGRGCSFEVRLPAPAVALPKPAPPAAKPEATPSHRVLVVDDNVDAATSLALLLRLQGSETDTAYDGDEAVSVAAERRPDVVLLDIGLPRRNGYDVCRAIRAEPWGRKITMIALTGWGQEQDRQRSAAAGFDHHLVKPVDPAALTRLLSGRGPPLSPPRRAAGSA